jgi:hypothetical protein
MAVKQNTSRNHATQFIHHLKPNERNALRVLLLTKTGLADLRAALGTQTMRVLSRAEVATGHAMRGTTVELFRNHTHHSPANLHGTDTHAAAGKAGQQ